MLLIVFVKLTCFLIFSVDIKAIACGPYHAVAAGHSSENDSGGEVYTWGKGANGRLGSGNEEDT